MAIKRPVVATRPSTPGVAVAVALLAVSVLISYVDRGNLSVAAPMLTAEMHLSASQLGVLLSGFFWTYTVMLFVCAAWIDRFDVNHVLALGFLVWSCATIATGWVHGFAFLLMARLCLGVGESISFPCYCKILAQQLPEARRGLANGAIIAGMKFGPALGTLGVGTIMARYGWRPAFVAIGLVSLLWLPAWLRWMPRMHQVGALLEPSPTVRAICRQRAFWGTVVGGFCNAYPLYFMVTWLPYYLVHEHHLTSQSMVYTAALYYSVDAAAALAAGWVADACIRGGGSVSVVRKTTMAIGFVTAACGFVGSGFAGHHEYLAWLMLTGLGAGAGNAGVWAFTQTLAGPAAAGRWASLQNGLGNFAGVIGPILTGYTVDWTGHFRLAVCITAGMCLLGAMSWVFLIGPFRPVNWATHGDG
jgi:MFS family permease